MLKQRNEQIQAAMRGLDLALCFVAFFGAYALRSSSIPLFSKYGGIEPIESLTWMLILSVVLHLILYPLNKFYESIRMKSISGIIGMVARSAVTEFFIMGTMVFLLQAKTTSRYFFGLFLVLNYSLILAEKLGVRIILTAIRKRGYNFRQVLLVGAGGNASRLIQSMRVNSRWGYVACGVLLPEGQGPTTAVKSVDGVPVLGSLADLESVVKKITVDEVIFALDRIDSEEVSAQMLLIQKIGIPTRFSLGLFDLPQSKVAFTHMDRIPLVTFYTSLRTPLEDFMKRAMDIGISLIGLLITGVLYPWIAFKIKSQSPGPVIFKQVRVGENGRRFKCYKFRTMVVDAEDQKAELLKNNKMDGPLFKIENDPRIFPFGQFLRKSSLDELPQFLNILRGDMSVVGTRPPTPDEVKNYETHYRRRLSVRPGLTGLWQVSGRNQITNFEDVLKLDLQYIDGWSLLFDLRIIVKTVWVALFRKGAY